MAGRVLEGPRPKGPGGGEVVVTEIDPRRQSGSQLRAISEVRFRELFDALPDAVVVLKGDRALYANAAARELLVEPEDERDVAIETLRASEIEARLARHAPTVVPVGDDRMIIARRAARDPIADHMASLATLAAGVGQAVGNPLTYVLVNLEHVTRQLRALAASAPPGALLDEEDPRVQLGAQIATLSQAIEGARQMRGVVRQLMTFARGADDERSTLDVRSVLESSLHMASHELRARARVIEHLAEVPPVRANAARLGQVFLSLLVNAAQSIDAARGEQRKREVRVSTREEEERVIIEISDTGAGISAEDVPRIFDPFFTTKRFGAALGLGLATAHGICASLGGELTVTSRPGVGSTFRVALPAARAIGERRRVLVVETDPGVGASIALALEADAEVTVVASSESALARLAIGDRFDCVLCDVSLPDSTAVDVFAEIVRIAPDVAGRVVFTSGGSIPPDLRDLVESTRLPCLRKPLDAEALRRAIRGER